jgi:hypothetical protein
VTVVRGCHDDRSAWRGAQVRGVVLSGGASCARDAIAATLSLRPRFAAGFDIDDLLLPAGSFIAAAGSFPFASGAAPGDWQKTHPEPPSFWTALARDAAVLAWASVEGLPAEGTEEPSEVEARRAMVRTTLEAAKLKLWTTDAPGFAGGRTLRRSISLADAPKVPAPRSR